MQDAEAVLNALTEVAVRDDDLQAVGSSLEKSPPTAFRAARPTGPPAAAGRGLGIGGRLAAALLPWKPNGMKPSIASSPPPSRLARSRRSGDDDLGLGLLLGDKHAEAVRVLRRGIADNLLPEGTAFHCLATALAMGADERGRGRGREAAEMVELNPRIESRLPWVYYQAQYDQAERGTCGCSKIRRSRTPKFAA